MSIELQKRSERVTSLDALRGIAALSVLFFHCAGVYPAYIQSVSPFHWDRWLEPWAWLHFTPLRLLLNGPGSVMLFFVLSGFVLSFSFPKNKAPSYWKYLLKRIIRIYPAFLVVILAAALFSLRFGGEALPGVSDWFTVDSWDRPATLWMVINDILMIGDANDLKLDNVIWSLVHEMRVSLIFPFLIICARAAPRASLAVTLAMYGTSVYFFAPFVPRSLLTSMAGSAEYLFLFVVGILLAERREWLVTVVRQLSPFRHRVLWIVTCLLAFFPTASPLAPLALGLASVGVIILTLASKNLGRILSKPLFVWLGNISYSLYLCHLVIILLFLHIFNSVLPLYLIISISIIVSFCCAQALYKYIELPFIQMGRKLSGSKKYNSYTAVRASEP